MEYLMLKTMMELQELAKELGVKLSDEEYDTLNGLVFHELGTIPEDGSDIEIDVPGLHISSKNIVNHQLESAIVTLVPIVEDVEEEVAKKVETVIGSPLLEVEREGDTVTITSKTFEFEQGIASDIWVIEHNFNKKPSVDVVDSSGSVQIPNEIIYDTPNKVTVLFLAAFKGKAFLN